MVMVERNDQDYPFIKETIKKRPVNKKAAVQKTFMLMNFTRPVFLPDTLTAAEM